MKGEMEIGRTASSTTESAEVHRDDSQFLRRGFMAQEEVEK
jgi:hypothetical protein